MLVLYYCEGLQTPPPIYFSSACSQQNKHKYGDTLPGGPRADPGSSALLAGFLQENIFAPKARATQPRRQVLHKSKRHSVHCSHWQTLYVLCLRIVFGPKIIPEAAPQYTTVQGWSSKNSPPINNDHLPWETTVLCLTGWSFQTCSTVLHVQWSLCQWPLSTEATLSNVATNFLPLLVLL